MLEAPERWGADQLGSSQAQGQGSELAHPNIHPICTPVEHRKSPVLQMQSFVISTAQGNIRISGRSPGEDPVLMVEQKPEVPNHTRDSLW